MSAAPLAPPAPPASLVPIEQNIDMMIYACSRGHYGFVKNMIQTPGMLKNLFVEVEYKYDKKIALLECVNGKYYNLVDLLLVSCAGYIAAHKPSLVKLFNRCATICINDNAYEHAQKFLSILNPPAIKKSLKIKISCIVPAACDEEIVPSEAADIKKCIICAERRVSTVVVPCGHSMMCVHCSRELIAKNHTNCPNCKTTMTQIIRIFD